MEYQPKVGVVSEAGEGGVRGRLLEDVVRRLRVGHYSLRTERAYLGWIRRFILANGTRHPRELGATHVEAFLTGLAVEGHVAASTQNQALSAILFLYRDVLGAPSGRGAFPRSCRKPKCGHCWPTWRGAWRCWRGCCTAPGCG